MLALLGLLAILSAVVTANDPLLAVGTFIGTAAIGWAAFTSTFR